MKTFGVIGAGNMGGGMVRNLLNKGWQVHVHDIDPTVMKALSQAGAQLHDSPHALALACKVLAIVVVDQIQVNQVLDGEQGLLKAVDASHTVLLCPTLGVEDVLHTAERLAARGAHLIDAPMSGGPVRAQEGSMSLMVACSQALFDRHAMLLHDLADPALHVSQRTGDGARTKLVNNLLAAINLVGASEVMNLAMHMGLDPQVTLDVIQSSSGKSWIAGDRLPRALVGDWAPRAHMTLLGKDTQLALKMAQQAGAPTPLGQMATAAFAQAIEQGWAAHDDAAMLVSLRGQRPEA